MKQVTIVDKIGSFGRNAVEELDNALRQSAVNILVASKNRAPFDKGGLRADTDVKRIQPLYWEVSYYKEYARFQEFGGDGKRKVKNYTTGGTGKKFLTTAGNNEVKKLMNKIQVYAGRAKA